MTHPAPEPLRYPLPCFVIAGLLAIGATASFVLMCEDVPHAGVMTATLAVLSVVVAGQTIVLIRLDRLQCELAAQQSAVGSLTEDTMDLTNTMANWAAEFESLKVSVGDFVKLYGSAARPKRPRRRRRPAGSGYAQRYVDGLIEQQGGIANLRVINGKPATGNDGPSRPDGRKS